MRQSTISKTITYVILIFGVLLIAFPLYITLMTAMKTPAESAASYLSPASSLYLDNFKAILQGSDYWKALRNTVYITAFVLLGNLAVMPMLSYAVSRSMGTSRFYRYLYYYLLIGIFIPFQVKMIPIVKLLSWLNLMNPTGLAILCIGSSTCESVFLYVGYMESIPKDIEEAAYIDGATTFQTYTRVILPLMRPILATVLIREGLAIWNDFQMPLVCLNRSHKLWTLTIYQNNFQSEYSVDYNLAFACLVVASLPIVIFYVVMQKQIIGGLTNGAVKG